MAKGKCEKSSSFWEFGFFSHFLKAKQIKLKARVERVFGFGCTSLKVNEVSIFLTSTLLLPENGLFSLCLRGVMEVVVWVTC